MRQALELAQRGAGSVEPNPMVGAVVVREGKVVGQGWHREFGGPHAEVAALKAAAAKAKGATLYVTLEPCPPHPKKTPPCTELLVRSGIVRVVAAMKDPNPSVHGRGLAILRKSKIRTSCGLLQGEARRLNAAFVKFHRTGLPYVLAKWAMTLDGKIATPAGDSRWVSCEASREWLHRLRDEYQAILIGANTALRDDPGLRGRKRLPVRIILDSYGRVPLDAKLVRTARDQRTILAVSGNAPAEKVRLLRRAGVEVIQLEVMDMRVLLQELAGSGIIKILVEGGGEVHASLFEEGLADEACVFLAPKIAGGRDAKTPVEGAGVERMADCLELDDVTVEKIDRDVVLRGRIRKS